jgi:hypothetical protein
MRDHLHGRSGQGEIEKLFSRRWRVATDPSSPFCLLAGADAVALAAAA